ncbi:MAG: type II toxin-antitoxin system RelE/ParE family toxin [Acidobacteriota bacterium]|nr:type II toxin-antitoxin system RelE/ParE family toxin [Acidobacteriota bacterium]
MKARWTKRALHDFERIVGYIETAADQPGAAHATAQKVWEATLRLEDFPRIGRPGRVEGTREWVVSKTPLILVYRVEDDRVILLRILHGAQRK